MDNFWYFVLGGACGGAFVSSVWFAYELNKRIKGERD